MASRARAAHSEHSRSSAVEPTVAGDATPGVFSVVIFGVSIVVVERGAVARQNLDLLYRASLSKRQRDFKKVQETKRHTRGLPTDELVKRYNSGYLHKAGAIAIREVLAERGESDRIGK